MEELLKWVPLAQVVTTAILTVVGLCVAVASLLVAYRNNFGWRPIIIIPGWGMRANPSSEKREGPSTPADYDNTVEIPIEVWNRRKYPVVVRHIVVQISERVQFEVIAPPTGHREGWHMNSERTSLTDPVTVAPSSHHVFECKVPFRTTSYDAMRAHMVITVSYFDPRKNKRYTLKEIMQFGLHE